MSTVNEWLNHVRPITEAIHKLAQGPVPERAGYFAQGAIDGLIYILAEANVPVPGHEDSY